MGKPLKPTKGVAIVRKAVAPINVASNGTVPTAGGGLHICDLANGIGAARGRVLFNKNVNTVTPSIRGFPLFPWSFACRTGPMTSAVRIRHLLFPALISDTSATSLTAYWTVSGGLTGTATSTTTGDTMTQAGVYNDTGGNSASRLFAMEQVLAVSPNTFYRFELAEAVGWQTVSVTVFEDTRATLDTTNDTATVDTTGVAYLKPITTAQLAALVPLADKIWRRGRPIYTYGSDPVATEIQNTLTATLTNVMDGNATTASSTSAGFPCQVSYSGSLDSSNVSAVFWIRCAPDASANKAMIQWRDQANNVLAEIAVDSALPGTPSWFATTGNLTDASGGTETTKIDILAKRTTASCALDIYSHGCFLHVLDDPRTAVTSATLVLWLDASDPLNDGSRPADGTAISSWKDKSGNGLNADQGTGANQPLLKRDIVATNKDVVRFDGTNDRLITADSSLLKATSMTLLVVYKASVTGASAERVVCGYPNSNATATLRYGIARSTDGGSTDKYITTYTNATGVQTDETTTRAGAFCVHAFTTSDNKNYFGGVQLNDGADPGSITYPNALGFYIGTGGNAATFASVDIAEIRVFSGTLSAAELASQCADLSVKWGRPLE